MKFPSLLELEPEQSATIDLPFRGNHVITGTPGGGKTVMAIYRAWALATAGRQVALVTRSRLLHQYLAQAAPDLTASVRVATYHRWFSEFWRSRFRCNPPVLDEEGWRFDWVEILRACIVNQVTSNVSLVIDEGQNLPVEFFRLVRILGIGITVFADDNQPIGEEQSTLSEICSALAVQENALLLRGNLRNSREIAMLASFFRKNVLGELPLPVRPGNTPTVGKVSSVKHLVAEISRYFGAHRNLTIGIICRSTRMLLEIQDELGRLGLAEQTQAYAHDDRWRSTVDFSTRPIRIVTTASMKGWSSTASSCPTSMPTRRTPRASKRTFVFSCCALVLARTSTSPTAGTRSLRFWRVFRVPYCPGGPVEASGS